MKMNVRSICDHDEGHYTSFVAIKKHRNHEEDWDGLYCSYHIKEAKKYHLTPKKVTNLWEKYVDSFYDAMDDDAEGYLTFDEWLDWKGYTSISALSNS